MNKQAQQTINRSIQTNKSTKVPIRSSSSINDFEMVFHYREQPVSDTFLENLALRLMDWAVRGKESLKLNVFLKENNIDRHSFHTWRKRCQRLDWATKFALNAIGDTREIGALKRKYVEGTVLKSMHQYDEDWKAGEEWRAKLNQPSDNKHSVFNIHIDEIPKVEENK